MYIYSERDRLHHRATELTHSLASKDQTNRGIEVERADLLTSYRAVLGEKRQLEVDLIFFIFYFLDSTARKNMHNNLYKKQDYLF
jgi:hypothetical protein